MSCIITVFVFIYSQLLCVLFVNEDILYMYIHVPKFKKIINLSTEAVNTKSLTSWWCYITYTKEMEPPKHTYWVVTFNHVVILIFFLAVAVECFLLLRSGLTIAVLPCLTCAEGLHFSAFHSVSVGLSGLFLVCDDQNQC